LFKKKYIIYDGSCNFCNKVIMFLAKIDKKNNFIFVSSLSNVGISLLLKHKIIGIENFTIILINEENVDIKSVAIRKIFLDISYYKFIGYLMFLLPLKISDYVYDIISKKRKKIMKKDICEIPKPEIRKKFIT
jgi:predicted DCC family thiol-disulfide oxidoreductase YuxK